jgi:hypothetical protein
MRLSAGLQPALFDDAGAPAKTSAPNPSPAAAFRSSASSPPRPPHPTRRRFPRRRHPVAVLSYAFWRRRFGASPSAIGRWVTVDRKQFQIVGIAAGPFGGVQPGYLTDLWLPLSAAMDPASLANPDIGLIQVWGRLHPGAAPAQMREPLQAAMTNFMRERFRINPPRNLHGDQLRQVSDAPLRIRDMSTGRDSLFRSQFRRPLSILALICALLLLVACSNVANLMIARASARAAEMALRLSLGAARSRLIQQLLVESAQLAAAACALGLAVRRPRRAVHRRPSRPHRVPRLARRRPRLPHSRVRHRPQPAHRASVRRRPCLRASAVSPGEILKAGGAKNSGRIGSLRWMLAAQVGFSVAVLFLSGLLLLSFRKLIAVDLGFARDNVVLFDLAPRASESHRPDSGTALLEHLRHLPAVQAASLSQQRPMGGAMVWIATPIIRLPGRANETIRPLKCKSPRDSLAPCASAGSPAATSSPKRSPAIPSRDRKPSLRRQVPAWRKTPSAKPSTSLATIPIPSRNKSSEWLPMPAITTSARVKGRRSIPRCATQPPPRSTSGPPPAGFAGPLAAQGSRNRRPYADRPRQYPARVPNR